MANSISIQPMRTTNGAGLFSKDTDGLIVGDYYPDPATRNSLAGGTLAETEALPMWGGVGISEGVSGDDQPTGGLIKRAADKDSLIGFSVNINSGINSPSSEVPLSSAFMQVNFFRIGSRQRIILEIDPSILGTVKVGLANQDLAWDFVNQKIIAGSEFKAMGIKLLSFSFNSKIVNYDAITGTANWKIGSAAVIQL